MPAMMGSLGSTDAISPRPTTWAGSPMKPGGSGPPDQLMVFTSCSPTTEPTGSARAATTSRSVAGAAVLMGVVWFRR